jgi:L-lactate dehydrogenase complex protein LldG
MNPQFEVFEARARSASAEVHRFTGKKEALAFLQDVLKEAGVSEAPQGGAVWAAGPFLDEAGKAELCAKVPGVGFEVTREGSAAAKVGISEMDWAIASTGTLVQDATAVEKRLVSALPPIHVALIGTDRILADMDGVLERMRPEQLAYIAFITGPSRTADIERVLTIGVHGPERLIVVVIDEFEQVTA